MRPFRNLTALVAVAVAVASTSSDPVHLRHSPEEGSSTSLRFVLVQELEGADLMVTMDDNEIPTEYLPDIDMEIRDERVVAFTETWEAVDADGPRTWLREYDEVTWKNRGEFSMDQMGEEISEPWASEGETWIEGRSVRFHRDDDGTVIGELVDGGDSKDGLDELEPDLGLSVLLPEEAVSLGDEWSVDADALGFLFEPGGDLGWEFSEEAARQLLFEVLDRSCEGRLVLTLDEIEDGIARCSVRGEILRTTVKPGDLSRVPVVDGTATDTEEEKWEPEGELAWSVEDRRIVSLHLEGDIRSETLTVRDPDQPGPTYESLFTMWGTFTVEVESDATATQR